MSDESDTSPNMAISRSQPEVVQACDESGVGEGEEEFEITGTTPLPPVGSVTTSSSFVDLSDDDLELLEFTASRMTESSDEAKVEVRSNKAENDELATVDSSRSQEISAEVPPSCERMDDSDAVSNSKACQTDWSWLAAYRAIKDKLPQPSSSTILKSKSGSKMSKTSVADVGETTEKPASSLSEDPDHVPRMLESLKSDPWPDRTDEYGIPIRNPSEDGEELDDAIVPNTAQKDESEAESKQEEDDEDETEDDDEDDDEEGEETEESLEQILIGICKFCGQEKKPFPSIEDQETKSPDELYCCSAFREYVTRTVTKTGQRKTEKVRRGQKSKKTERGRRRSRPASEPRSSGDEGSEQRTKTRGKRVQAGERTRRRSSSRSEDGRKKSPDEKRKPRRESKSYEDEFHRKTHSRRNSRSAHKDDDTDKPCIVYGHEMTTINYQLSSRQCRDWTIGLDSGATRQQQPETVHVVEPIQLQGRSHVDPSTSLLCQTYQTGSPFLIIFADGSGNVFYPSGQIAVSIISSKDGDYTYIIQDTNSRVLGIYEPNGKTVTYNQNGSIRVFTDETGGLELDAEGNRRKHWKWNEKEQHVHAPPLYAVTCSISSSFTFSISSQHEMTLLFNRSHRACRFNVGSSPHGAFLKKSSLISDVLNENELYITDVKSRIRDILQKTSVLLRYPASPRAEGTLTPVAFQKRRGTTPSSKTQRRGSRILPAIND